MAVKLISYDESTKHSSFVCDDFSSSDKMLLGQKPGDRGKEQFFYHVFGLGDIVIDMKTKASHWLTSNGWN